MFFHRLGKSVISFFILICTTYMSQAQSPVKNYDKEWKKIEDLAGKQGRPQSAIEELNKLYALAKAEKQEAQVIKILIYRNNLQQNLTENAPETGIAAMEKELTDARGPAKSLLSSILASQYQQYFQANRYKLYDRTQTVNFVKTDIATWGLEDFHKRIGELYLASIADEKLLQQTKLDPYAALMVRGNTPELRPTLFDLLAFQALTYFGSDERDIKRPAYAFTISEAQAYAPAAEFVKHKFQTRDENSLHHKALLIYQSLLRFHSQDANPAALIDADIQRLAFVNSHATHPDKKNLYKKALEQLGSRYPGNPYAALAWSTLAGLLAQEGQAWKPGSTDKEAENGLVRAKEICEKVIAQKEKSEGKTACQNLLISILSKSISLQTERVNLPGQPFRALVTYRNADKIQLRLIAITDALKKDLQRNQWYEEKIWQKLAAQPAVQSWSQALPAANDYRSHTTEIKADAPAAGEYVLLASNTGEFTPGKNVLAAHIVIISTISYINNNETDYFILHRETGQPLAGAKLMVYKQNYDYTESAYRDKKIQEVIADKTGLARLKNSGTEYINVRVEIEHGKEKFSLNEYNYLSGARAADPDDQLEEAEYMKRKSRLFLFTDRSIYRPGQTVYFKGIAITQRKNDKSNLLYTGRSSTISLYNVNGELVDTLKVTTNEYGSYSGKLKLPEGQLNGQFSLRDDGLHGGFSFQVEEYKRPKFFVEYEPLRGLYRVNDSIRLTGVAKAFAGNNIDGAEVKYRVVRETRFMYYWMFWRWGLPQVTPMEIASGVAKTDANGKFTVTFNAIPDLSLDKSTYPVFDYKVEADVTDINGETRSAETVVPVSYQALQVKIAIPGADGVHPVDSLGKIKILTTNLNGGFEPAGTRVKIHQLETPKRLIRQRFWSAPDQFVMNEQEYLKHFPYDEYKNESDHHSWKTAATPVNSAYESKEDGIFTLPEQVPPGWYMIEVSAKDKFGEEVKAVEYVELKAAGRRPAVPVYSRHSLNNTSPEPGSNAISTLTTSADNIFVIRQVSKKNDDNQYDFFNLNNEIKDFSYPVAEADRGGFNLHYAFVKHNRMYYEYQMVAVPWNNKELKVKFATWREKTLPGSAEQWKVTISGNKNEKLAAEMLASMYDASLDQFRPHGWNQPAIWNYFYQYQTFNSRGNFTQVSSQEKNNYAEKWSGFDKRYDQFSWAFGLNVNYQFMRLRGAKSMDDRTPMMELGAPAAPMANAATADTMSFNGDLEYKKEKDKTAPPPPPGQPGEPRQEDGGNNGVQVRKNFSETAFFLPDLRTDADGNISFAFTMPEALTQWKFQGLAHTRDMAFGLLTGKLVTQKDLMVQPNAPRFMREGDRMEFSAKLSNVTDKELTGQAELQLLDGLTMQPVDGWFKNMFPVQYFTAPAGGSVAVKFPIEIPYTYSRPLVYRIIARSGDISDGEENILPVITNRILVTEPLPLPVRGNATKQFKLNKLISNNSESLQHYGLTVEFTSNPAWYAVQALPYLTEYPYECAEQTWNRFYANSLASMIANAAPRVKEIFEKWKSSDTAALLSNLQKNEDLKSILLQETPWVMEAKNESEQKRRIALLFDMVRMSKELASSLEKLKAMQSANGGFVWFKGGPDDRYITQYIATGIGHLRKLGAVPARYKDMLEEIAGRAIPYLDRKLEEEYKELLRRKAKMKENHLSYTAVQYLYMRSFFPNHKMPAGTKTAFDYYTGQARKFWLGESRYTQGMLALALHRGGDMAAPAAILRSLKENAIVNEEMGMYWKDIRSGWYWYESPIEIQALLIEAFKEAGKDTKTVDDLRTWLLKQKQTQNWKTTRATAEACYALLLEGTQWLSAEPVVEIKLGNAVVKSTDNKTEAGTGYFKQSFRGDQVNNEMGNISVTVSSAAPGNAPSWGAVYWQYFESLDKITPAATPLSLKKKLFVEKASDRGPVLKPVNEGDAVQVGDKIKVRIELRVDRDMEYIHMRDIRGACFEPVNVISEYKWQGGLGYYETTKDASTNFFFGWLPKGTYVFEYPMFVTHAGNFSTGLTSIQCMYAPEFASHSEGGRINAENK